MSAAMNTTNTADSSSSSSAQPPPRQSSATSTVGTVPMTSTSNIASVHFKVRCERLGHGEDVYLTPLEEYEDAAMNPVTIAQLLLQPPSPTNRHKVRNVSLLLEGRTKIEIREREKEKEQDIECLCVVF